MRMQLVLIGQRRIYMRSKRAISEESCLYRLMAATKSLSADPTFRILKALAEPTRYRIMNELLKSGPNTALPLAGKLGSDVKKVSRHMHILKRMGALEQWIGRVFRIPERFLVAGESVIDFGSVRVQFK